MSDKRELKKKTIKELIKLKRSMMWLSDNWTHEWLDGDYPYAECFADMANATPKWVDEVIDRINTPYASLDEFRLSRRRIFTKLKYEEISGADAPWLPSQAKSILVYEYGFFWILEQYDGTFFTDVWGSLKTSDSLEEVESFLYEQVKWEIGGEL